MKDVRRLPSPREYQAMTFAGKQEVIDRVQQLLFAYLVTERGNDVQDRGTKA